MKFFNINTAPKKTLEKEFEGKLKHTGVGFISLGTRIRGLLANNKLDLTGVEISDDYDIAPGSEDDKVYEKDVPYDETQDYMDKIDVLEKSSEISSKLSNNVEEQLSEKIKNAKEKNSSVLSEKTPPTSTGEAGTE